MDNKLYKILEDLETNFDIQFILQKDKRIIYDRSSSSIKIFAIWEGKNNSFVPAKQTSNKKRFDVVFKPESKFVNNKVTRSVEFTGNPVQYL